MSAPPARHVRLEFNIAAPEDAKLIVEHLDDAKLLARERIPVAAGTTHRSIKTHPEASRIACSMEVAGRPVDHVRFTAECGESIKPVARHFIVVGAMKAGTTTLFQLLAQHPAICRSWAEVPGLSFIKEINYFTALYREGHTPLHYDWRFPFVPSRHAWTLDVSPNYAKLWASKPVPSRIAELGAEVKLAYILRNPLDRIESHIAHTLREGRELKNLNHCIRVSRYAQHLDRFVKHVSRDNILLLDFEQLRRDPAGVQIRVCDFLGIERVVTPARIHNKRSVKFSLTAAQRAEIVEAVRTDVQRLMSDYDFKPAASWLREPKSWRVRLPTFRS
jgi:hypothetical protein